jgi:flagellar basal-body rod protein FlgC
MDFFDALKTSSTGLSAQRVRMNLISGNLANANTTRTADGGPYRRKEAIFAAAPNEVSFNEMLASRRQQTLPHVKVVDVFTDNSEPIRKFDPNHPDADELGYVSLPNVNVMEEMVNLISATRSYEANVAAIKAAKEMALKALEIGK